MSGSGPRMRILSNESVRTGLWSAVSYCQAETTAGFFRTTKRNRTWAQVTGPGPRLPRANRSHLSRVRSRLWTMDPGLRCVRVPTPARSKPAGDEIADQRLNPDRRAITRRPCAEYQRSRQPTPLIPFCHNRPIHQDQFLGSIRHTARFKVAPVKRIASAGITATSYRTRCRPPLSRPP
jgi:hypothetical protein